MRLIVAAAVTLVCGLLSGPPTCMGQQCVHDPGSYAHIRGKEGPYGVDMASLQPYKLKEWQMGQPWKDPIRLPKDNLTLVVGGTAVSDNIEISWGNKWTAFNVNGELCVFAPDLIRNKPVCILPQQFSTIEGTADTGLASIYLVQRGQDNKLQKFVDSIFHCEGTKLDRYLFVDADCVETAGRDESSSWRVIIGTTSGAPGEKLETWVATILSSTVKNTGKHYMTANAVSTFGHVASDEVRFFWGSQPHQLINVMSLQNGVDKDRSRMKYRTTKYSSLCRFRPRKKNVDNDYNYYDYLEVSKMPEKCVHRNAYDLVRFSHEGAQLDLARLKPYLVKRWVMDEPWEEALVIPGDRLPLSVNSTTTDGNISLSWGNSWNQNSLQGELCLKIPELSSPVCLHPADFRMGSKNTAVAAMYLMERDLYSQVQLWVDEAFKCSGQKLEKYLFIDADCIQNQPGAPETSWRMVIGTTGGEKPETWLAVILGSVGKHPKDEGHYVRLGAGRFSWSGSDLINVMNLDKGVHPDARHMRFVSTFFSYICPRDVYHIRSGKARIPKKPRMKPTRIGTPFSSINYVDLFKDSGYTSYNSKGRRPNSLPHKTPKMKPTQAGPPFSLDNYGDIFAGLRRGYD